MAAIDSNDLVKEYFEEVKKKYPTMTLEATTTICKTAFLFVRRTMESVDFPIIRIKYFGKFVVFPGNVRDFIKVLGVALKLNRITQEQHDQRTEKLKAYLNEYENQDSLDS